MIGGLHHSGCTGSVSAVQSLRPSELGLQPEARASARELRSPRFLLRPSSLLLATFTLCILHDVGKEQDLREATDELSEIATPCNSSASSPQYTPWEPSEFALCHHVEATFLQFGNGRG